MTEATPAPVPRTAPEAELDQVLELERELQTAATRRDPHRLRELLDPEFVEIGASGRRWDRGTVLDLLAAEDDGRAPITVRDLHARPVTADVVQVFWESERGAARARRTSLWRRGSAGWRQVYHQGTPRSGPGAGS